MQIKFNHDDIISAKECAVERYTESRKLNLKQTKILPKRQKIHEIHGALGEIAVCKALGLEWTGKGSCITEKNLPKHLIPADVEGLEVRATAHAEGRLIIRPRDVSEAKYVLVIIYPREKTAKLVGWIIGADAKVKENLIDLGGYGKPCYVIEHENLRPMKELVNILNKETT